MKFLLLLCALLCPAVVGADEFDDAALVCRAIESTGMSPECTLGARTIDVRFNTNAANAREICAGIVESVAQKTRSLAGTWKLRIFSPYSGDHPIAVCTLK
jgi:hypothetical protein